MRLPFTVAKHLIPDPDGTGKDFEFRFPTNAAKSSKIHVLGKGQFGQVLLLQDATAKYACKVLRKGLVFEDNIIYTQPKAPVLRGEVEILRTLRNESYCLHLNSVYESPRAINLVTELCQGGDMIQWVARHDDLQVADVMRITRQLFTALSHCDRYGILHRDIKPENIMFLHDERASDLRLIDFGSGCIDDHTNDTFRSYKDRTKHQTFAGTAFYIAPEVFQQNYTGLADVWSAAVTIYVLVASYPAASLQKAFNLLHKSDRDLRTLPGHDTEMPDTYFGFLTKALTYWPEQRPTANTLLSHPFLCVEGNNNNDDDYAVPQLMSWSLDGAARRHVASKEYQDEHQDAISSWSERLMSGYEPCSITSQLFSQWSSLMACNATEVWSY